MAAFYPDTVILLQVVTLMLSIAMATVSSNDVMIDPNGYILYCPCMGRFGNQADHFLGVLGFAKGLDRTLVLPPWIEYPKAGSAGKPSVQIPFDTYFQVQPLREYHKVITMEDFMKNYAPLIWPVGQRIGFCYSFGAKNGNECKMKDGNPFGPFWDNFNIEFDSYQSYGPQSYDTSHPAITAAWHDKFPVSSFPVLAFSGSPASFPVNGINTHLHRYLIWSDFINDQAEEFVTKELPDGPFVGIHLRHGSDWKQVCNHILDKTAGKHLFASPQCLGYNNEHGHLNYDLCFPSISEILKKTRQAVKKINAKGVFVASDDNPLLTELTKSLKRQKVKVVERRPKDPHVDLSILAKSDLYICNCLSSFSAFATRERAVLGKITWFWGFDEGKKTTKEEL